jgi:hypothetical protein
MQPQTFNHRSNELAIMNLQWKHLVFAKFPQNNGCRKKRSLIKGSRTSGRQPLNEQKNNFNTDDSAFIFLSKENLI